MTLGNDHNGTDGQTDRVRRNMRPPPREEGRIISYKFNSMLTYIPVSFLFSFIFRVRVRVKNRVRLG